MNNRLIWLVGLVCIISGGIYLSAGRPACPEDASLAGRRELPTINDPSPGPAKNISLPHFQPGAWVRYHIKRSQMDNAGFKTVWESDLKISITGQEKKGTQQSYEVELAASATGALPENTRLIKFRLSPTGEPLMDQLTIKHPHSRPVEINLSLWSEKTGLTREDLFREMIDKFLIIPLVPPPTESEADSIDLSLKETPQPINCQRYLIQNPRDETATKIWFSEEVFPFPSVAKMLIFEEDFQTQIMLVDYATTGAESLFKEKPMRLEFKEGK